MWPKNTGLDKQENWERRLCSSTVSIPIFLSSYFFLNREHLLDGRLTLVKFYSHRLVRVHHGPGLSLCFHCAVWKQLTWRRHVLQVERSPVWHHPTRPGKHLIRDLREDFELRSLGLEQGKLGQTEASFPLLKPKRYWSTSLSHCS